MSPGADARSERGALATITPEQVSAACRLASSGEVVELGVPLGPQTPVPAHRHGVLRFMNRDGGDYAAGARRPDGFQFAEDTVVLPTHIGTHVDALAHVWHDDVLFDGSPQETIRSTSGATRCGVEKLGPIVTRGVLLDVAAEQEPSAGAAIGAADLEAAAAAAGVAVEPGDVVLVRTGWLGATGGDAAAFYAGEPGLDLGAAEWLAERGASVVGADNFAVEQIPFPEGRVFPVHQLLIAERGIPLLEGVALDQLATRASGPFLFVALPLSLVGCTASPLAPVAIL